MAHNLIIGMTESGKSSLAKFVCSAMKAKQIKTAVLDPLHDTWDCDFQTSNPDEFLRFVKSNRSYQLFVDESGTSIGRYNPAMEWLATTSRHLGHACWFIMQGSSQVMPIVRTNCAKCFLFTTDSRMTEVISREFCEQQLMDLPPCEKLHFRIISRYLPMRTGRVDFDPPGVYIGGDVQGDRSESADQGKKDETVISNSASPADDGGSA